MKKLLVLAAVAIGLSSCGLLPTHRTIICNGPVQEMPMEKIKNFTDVTIDGEADLASFTITGKGLIDALHLECQNIEQHVSGSGTIKL